MIPSIFHLLPKQAPTLYKVAGVALESETPITGEDSPKKDSPFTTALKGTLAYGAGVGLGTGAGMLLNHAAKKTTGRDLDNRYLIPLGAATGLAGNYLYNKWKAEELGRMQDAHKAQRNSAQGRVSGQQL